MMKSKKIITQTVCVLGIGAGMASLGTAAANISFDNTDSVATVTKLTEEEFEQNLIADDSMPDIPQHSPWKDKDRPKLELQILIDMMEREREEQEKKARKVDEMVS